MKTKTPKLPLRPFASWDEDMVKIELGLKKVRSSPLLTEWTTAPYTPSNAETEAITRLKDSVFDNVVAWNEDELKFKFLGPFMQIINFDQEDFRAFTQRKIEAIIETTDKKQIRVGGVVDFVVAMGRVNPRHPFFFLHEYKKERGSANDPLAQVLVEMLAAQTLNGTSEPMYGCYIVGRNWFFIVLEGSEYAVSSTFDATQNDIFQITAILKAIKKRVEDAVAAV
jgi:hypothetical protein